MSSFKNQIRRDLKTVFHNPDEHAEMAQVEYHGKAYNIPVVIDHEGAKDRAKPSSDHGDGIFVADLTVYIAYGDLAIMPRKETKIEISGNVYNIIKVSHDEDEIILNLEMLDE